MASTTLNANKSEPYFPLAGMAKDYYSNEDEATATCFCGAVQLAFPPKAPGLVGSFRCNCFDCHKVTASAFASNFTVRDSHLIHVRGRENLSTWGQAHTVASGNRMDNYFCKTCGTLMYRVSSGYPGMSILRIGTVDDFNLQETVLKPEKECFVGARFSWMTGLEGEGVPQLKAFNE